MQQLDFRLAAKGILEPATMAPTLQMIFGNMILRPMPGRRKPISEEQRDTKHSAFPLAVRGISVPASIIRIPLETISGNMILLPMRGHRKLTSEERQGELQLDFQLGTVVISVPAMMVIIKMISGNMILRPIHGHRRPTSEEQ